MRPGSVGNSPLASASFRKQVGKEAMSETSFGGEFLVSKRQCVGTRKLAEFLNGSDRAVLHLFACHNLPKI